MVALGIDLGTSFARVAVASRGRATLASDPSGASIIPSVLAFPERGGLRVGTEAVGLGLAPSRTVRGAKRWLGVPWADASLRGAEVEGLALTRGRGGAPFVELEPDARSFVELASLQLKALRELAAEGEAVKACALGAPTWFGAGAREALEKAAASAGLAIRTLVPDAVALVAGFTPKSPRIVGVIDVGAGGASVAILESGASKVRLLGSAGCEGCGGDAVDAALLGIATWELADHGVPLSHESIDPELRALLMPAFERMRRELSKDPQAHYLLSRLGKWAGASASGLPVLTLETADLEAAIIPNAEVLERCARAALAAAGVERSRVEAVYVAGGMAAHRGLVARSVEVLGGSAQERPEGSLALGLARIAQGVAGLAPPIALELAEWGQHIEAPPREPLPRRRPKASAVPSASTFPPASASAAGPSSVPPPRHETDRPSTPPSRVMVQSAPRSSTPTTVVAERGRFVSPLEPAAYLRVPLTRALTDADLNPIALPVLMRRVFARGSLTGTAFLEHREGVAEVPIVGGLAYISQREQVTLRRAFFAREGTWRLDTSGMPSLQGRTRSTMLRLVVDGMRTVARDWTTDGIATALRDKLAFSPVVPPERTHELEGLGLLPVESRTIQFGFDGRQPAGEILEQATSSVQVSPRLMIMLEVLGMLQWKPVQAAAKRTLAEELQLEAETVRNHFEVLDLHWSATSDDVARAYERVTRELAPGGTSDRVAPAACVALRKRAAEAFAVMSDERRRVEYRQIAYPNLDLEALSDFLEKKLKALELRGDEKEMAVERAALKEIGRTAQLRPKRRTEIE